MFLKQARDEFNITDSGHIPKTYVDMAHQALAEYQSIIGYGLDESGFDSY